VSYVSKTAGNRDILANLYPDANVMEVLWELSRRRDIYS
jgi:hypothetical protein